MYTVHTMFRREFALLPGLVRGVAATDVERAEVVAAHIRLLTLLVHSHHTIEDEHLWPPLLKRAPRDVDPVVTLLEGQHDRLDVLLSAVGRRLAAWTDGADGAEGEALAAALQRLAAGLYEHMDLEEKLALPLFERYLFATEWAAMAQAAHAGMPPEAVPVIVGMVAYEGGLDFMPPGAREALAEIAPKAYAEYSGAIHGTATPPRSTQVGLGTPYVGRIDGQLPSHPGRTLITGEGPSVGTGQSRGWRYR
jgi:hemerythrin-like domain-containing protein